MKLRDYKGVSALKKTALNILVKMTADSKDVEQVRETFMKIDKDQTGYISAQELKTALDEAGLKYDDQELTKIISEVDYHGTGQRINYTEFLAATISVKKILTNDRLIAMFKQFDTDNSGYITTNDIIEAMQKLG
jgi:calcium-dependent protein kinase